MRILIVDDDAVVRHILTAFLNGYATQFVPANNPGVEVSVATSGTEGLEILGTALKSNTPPDAVFLDLQLMDMTGVEVMEQVEAQFGDKHPPIISMSAQPIGEVQKHYPGRDWSLFLQKPFLPETVIEILKQVTADI